VTVTCKNCGASWAIEPKRRQNQSNLLHKIIAHVAASLGYDVAYLKVELKLRYGPWLGYPLKVVPEWPGKFVAEDWAYDITGYPAVFLKSEAAYTKDEETRLMDGVIAYANENQVDLDWMEE